jgi:hypothetical protein
MEHVAMFVAKVVANTVVVSYGLSLVPGCDVAMMRAGARFRLVKFKARFARPPVVAPPIVREPVVQEPIAQEPIAQEPVVQMRRLQPLHYLDEPIAQEPVVHESIVQPVVVASPIVQEPIAQPAVVAQAAIASPKGKRRSVRKTHPPRK